MNDKWYLKKGDQVFGPVSTADVQGYIKSGKLTHDQVAAQNETGPWKPLKNYDVFKESPSPIGEMFESAGKDLFDITRQIPTLQGSANNETTLIDDAYRKCDKCESYNEQGTKYCKKCGALILDPVVSQNEAVKVNPSKKGPGTGSYILFALIMIGAIYASFNNTPSKQQSPQHTTEKGSVKDSKQRSSKAPAKKRPEQDPKVKIFKAVKALCALTAIPYFNKADEIPDGYVESEEQVFNRLRANAIKLGNINSGDSDLNKIIKTISQNYVEGVERLNNIKSIRSQKPSAVDWLKTGRTILKEEESNMNEKSQVVSTFAKTIQAYGDEQSEKQAFYKAMNRANNAFVSMSKVLNQYSGPPTDLNITMDLNEHMYGSAKGRDYLWLTNSSGITMKDVVLFVEINGVNGERTYNAHYINEWAKDSSIKTVYHNGYDYKLPQTVEEIDNVRLLIWTPKLSSKADLIYQYKGDEKDADLKRYLKDLKVADIKYQRYDEGMIWNDYRGIKLLLDGWSFRKHEVCVKFIGRNKDEEYCWEKDEWGDQTWRTFATKEWLWDPETVEAELRFPGSKYVHKLGSWNIN